MIPARSGVSHTVEAHALLVKEGPSTTMIGTSARLNAGTSHGWLLPESPAVVRVCGLNRLAAKHHGAGQMRSGCEKIMSAIAGGSGPALSPLRSCSLEIS